MEQEKWLVDYIEVGVWSSDIELCLMLNSQNVYYEKYDDIFDYICLN